MLAEAGESSRRWVLAVRRASASRAAARSASAACGTPAWARYSSSTRDAQPLANRECLCQPRRLHIQESPGQPVVVARPAGEQRGPLSASPSDSPAAARWRRAPRATRRSPGPRGSVRQTSRRRDCHAYASSRLPRSAPTSATASRLNCSARPRVAGGLVQLPATTGTRPGAGIPERRLELEAAAQVHCRPGRDRGSEADRPAPDGSAPRTPCRLRPITSARTASALGNQPLASAGTGRASLAGQTRVEQVERDDGGVDVSIRPPRAARDAAAAPRSPRRACRDRTTRWPGSTGSSGASPIGAAGKCETARRGGSAR